MSSPMTVGCMPSSGQSRKLTLGLGHESRHIAASVKTIVVTFHGAREAKRPYFPAQGVWIVAFRFGDLSQREAGSREHR
jgi:hypothetical protein